MARSAATKQSIAPPPPFPLMDGFVAPLGLLAMTAPIRSNRGPLYASHPAGASRQRASFVNVSGDPVFARASSSLR